MEDSIKSPTATQIDQACQAGFFVFVGNRQQVLGAVDRRKSDLPVRNKVWIHRASDLAWEYVDANTVVITTETFGRRRKKIMATGKRAPGSPSHLNAVKTAPPGAVAVSKAAPRLPGMTGNSIKEIDAAGAKLLDVQERKKALVKEEKEANDLVVQVMKKHKKDYYCYDQLEVWVELGKAKAKAKHKAPKKSE